MGRPLRNIRGGLAYHVLNRGNARMTLFEDEADYLAFCRVLAQAVERFDMRLCAFCLMPNHFHLVLWPRRGRDGDLSRFMGWLTLTHTQRWHAHRHSVGTGHVYQGRFKSFPVQEDEHFAILCRYVERNALRAGLVRRAEDWPWSSLAGGGAGPPARGWSHEGLTLADWPRPKPPPAKWKAWVNRPQGEAELEALRRSVNRGQPYGGERWVEKITTALGLESTFRPRGRPRKAGGSGNGS